MLVFGCPQSDPEHRYHAMECALQIRDRITAINQERSARQEPCLDIRIGVSGGTVLAGLLGSHERMQYTVIGEAANLASRLCDLADLGQVVTDETFYALLHKRHPLQVLSTEKRSIKGFQSAVEVLTINTWAAKTAFKEQPDSDIRAADVPVTRESEA